MNRMSIRRRIVITIVKMVLLIDREFRTKFYLLFCSVIPKKLTK